MFQFVFSCILNGLTFDQTVNNIRSRGCKCLLKL